VNEDDIPSVEPVGNQRQVYAILIHQDSIFWAYWTVLSE
jgi:hypothetical protein